MIPVLLAAATVVASLPCGYWRAGQRKYSVRWFLAVHAPVPVVLGLRWLLGIGFRADTLPWTVAAYALGQFAGGRLHARRRRRASPNL